MIQPNLIMVLVHVSSPTPTEFMRHESEHTAHQTCFLQDLGCHVTYKKLFKMVNIWLIYG